MSHALTGLYVHDTGGDRPPAVFIHGTATDADTWVAQRAGLADHLRVITYDRRGTARSALAPERASYSVRAHASDAAALIEARCDRPPIVCGSSFGAVVALELARAHGVVGALVLCEPPMRAPGEPRPLRHQFAAHLESIAADRGGEAAAEHFLRRAIGDAAVAAMSARRRAASVALHRQVLSDCAAVADYNERYDALGDLRVRTLLIGGARSARHFALVLDALHARLPNAERLTVDAGHMMHVQAAREVNAALLSLSVSRFA